MTQKNRGVSRSLRAGLRLLGGTACLAATWGSLSACSGDAGTSSGATGGTGQVTQGGSSSTTPASSGGSGVAGNVTGSAATGGASAGLGGAGGSGNAQLGGATNWITSAGGALQTGGTTSRGGATSTSPTSAGGTAQVAGTTGRGGTSSTTSPTVGGTTQNGGTTSRGGASSTTTTTSVGGTTSTACPALALTGIDAQTLTGASTPLQNAPYGVRNYSAPVLVDGKHDPANYQAAPVKPTWQFATTDPTGGVLSALECSVAPDVGFHGYKRKSGSFTTHEKVVVTGGRNATGNHVYTVYNGQQLIAAINQAGLSPKIIRVVGHIDLRMSANNTVFKEYTSYSDQKFGGSINIPSNTTLVGINAADGKPARITGTAILVGGELAQTSAGEPEADFKAWIAAGKDGDAYPTWTRNVIVRNLKIDTPWDVNPEDSANAYADGVTISRSQNIWFDHVSITDGDTPDTLATDTRHDGSLDIVRGSDYVTVSHSFFGDHGKNSLVGNGDSGRAWSDQNRLHVSFYGLWWYGIASRHPLIRFGQLHTFNNLMQGTSTTLVYGHKFEGGLDVRYQSDVLSENNFHLFTGLKLKEVCGKLAGGKDAIGFRVSGNYFISDKTDDGKAWTGGAVSVDTALSTCAELPAAGTWVPPYTYSLLTAEAARTAIEAGTGAGRIGQFAKPGP